MHRIYIICIILRLRKQLFSQKYLKKTDNTQEFLLSSRNLIFGVVTKKITSVQKDTKTDFLSFNEK